MSVKALPTVISADRMKKAASLKVQLIKFAPFEGVTEAVVVSGTDPNKKYSCSTSLNPPRTSCQCEDFTRNLTSCKHIAAMCMVAARLWQGLSVSDIR